MRLSSRHFLLAGIAGLCLAGCSQKEAEAPAAPRTARVVVVTPHKFKLVTQGAGRIQSRYVSQVGFEVGGRLISRDVDAGATVKKGQKLAALSAVDYQNKVTATAADLDAAKAALAQAAAQEERFRLLLGKGFATHSQYDEALKSLRSAQAQVQATEANLRIAQNQLAYTELQAPDDGIVTATGADPGQVVAAGQMVIEISRNDEREAVFAVASEDIVRASLGMPVNVALQAHPEIAVTGTVREISPEADSATGTYQVKVAIPAPLPQMRLGAIVVGRVESDQGHMVATLPPSALLQSGSQPQVWVVGKDDKVERRKVQLLEFDANSVTVSQGLAAGDKVVVAGVNSLADGELVKPSAEVE
ncbi:efflux RND transporter periplasmic adaptor subunit [Mesorhizobium sp. B3-1-6]|uniref:efflux RND transporter periplasmic adaptor subunit n=1 Tax=Mesorhizobium sp. B3-1-6 TaxID=2589895 RepID=UPI00112CFC95|nr:efflux RND transporter periplasmic adaptor subunit [Mesorhizobium sp. B3-1-6]TPI43189.1 efflux RND transporter periplasmic adaptor subunit [Mesorhizobium sp. B3-1-6]